MRNSFVVGFIAGAIAGIVPFAINIPLGLMGLHPAYVPPYTITFLVSGAMTHIGFNAIWGSLFGIIFAIMFNRIPSSWIKKGLFIGLIYSLFSCFQPAYSFWTHGNIWWAIGFIVNGPQDKFVYGILFAYLYKK